RHRHQGRQVQGEGVRLEAAQVGLPMWRDMPRCVRRFPGDVPALWGGVCTRRRQRCPGRGGGMTRRPHYEEDDATFSAPAYTVDGWGGVAWYARGWETAPTEDTEWDGIEERTGKVVMTMVGDDRRFVVDLDDITPLEREAYCGECGQVGCTHDGVDRE